MSRRSAIGKVAIALAVLAVILVAVSAFIIFNEASNQLCAGCAGQSIPYSSTQTTSIFTNPNNTMSVSGLSLCASACGYPSPYASALITFNATVPVSSVEVYVNGTYESVFLQNPTTTTIACSTAAGQMCSVELGGTAYSNATYSTSTRYYATCSVPSNGTSCIATSTGSVNTLTRFADEWKGSVPNKYIPVAHGLTYLFTFVATFQDGSSATATASTIAS
jgi:hypothetical protein